MKVSALLSSSGYETEGQRLAHFREHNVLFAAGILTWFLVLAFCVGALGLAWGGLFQNTHLVYGLLILVFLLSLSLFDVFTLPVLDFKVGASRNPKTQAYLTGLVATLLATRAAALCSAACSAGRHSSPCPLSSPYSRQPGSAWPCPTSS